MHSQVPHMSVEQKSVILAEILSCFNQDPIVKSVIHTYDLSNIGANIYQVNNKLVC